MHSVLIILSLLGGVATTSVNARHQVGFVHTHKFFRSIGTKTHHDVRLLQQGKDFEPHSVLENVESSSHLVHKEQPEIQHQFEQKQQQQHDTNQEINIQRRQFIIASIALATTSTATISNAATAASTTIPTLTEKTNYQQSPINKRSGRTLTEPESTYPLSFITYLSRFLLVFDDECTNWWYKQAQAIPAKSSKEDVEKIRLAQFGQFAASVEVGLIDFEGQDGVNNLIASLVKRYGPSSLIGSSSNSSESGVGDGDSSSKETKAKESTTVAATEREVRKSKEALRQIALLFSIMKEYQPVDTITQILAADDDARIDTIEIVDGGAGYPPPFDFDNNATDTPAAPKVTFPDPPTMGTDFPGSIAKGVAIMKETGRILRIEITNSGAGYINAPTVDISCPEGDNLQAIGRAYLGKRKLKGSVDRIELINPGMGYSPSSQLGITVTISPPESNDGVTATARPILEYEVSDIKILDKGRGYAAEKAIVLDIEPPPGAASGSGGSRSAFAVSYPKGKSTSYQSFIGSGSDSTVQSSLSNVDTSQWISGPSSRELLALLPSGFGVQYNDNLGRYILSRSSMDNNWEDIRDGKLQGQMFKPINPIFGFRGRSPIEREKTLDVGKVLRFVSAMH